MAKKKQPYMPFYTGDHIKDTRSLSLAAKGAWSDLILFMWVNESGGILEGTMEDFARMVGCSEVNFVAVLNELKRKNICNIHGDETKLFKIVCRRHAREAEISEIRRDAVNTRYKNDTNESTKPPTKPIQNPDNDIDNDNESEFKYELKESDKKSQTIQVDVPQGTPDTLLACEQWTNDVIDGNDVYFISMIRTVSLNGRLEELARSHLALLSRYAWHEKMTSQQAFRNSLLDHVRKELKNGPERPTKTATTGNRNTDHIAGLAADHARRYGADGSGTKG